MKHTHLSYSSEVQSLTQGSLGYNKGVHRTALLPGGSRGESASLPLSSFRGCQHPLTHGRFPPSKPGARSRVLAMHRPNVCFLLSLLFLPCLSLAKACLGFTSTIQNFYTLVLRPAGLAALIPSPAPVPFVVQHDALIGSGMRAQMSMRRPVFLPPPHCVAMQIPGLRPLHTGLESPSVALESAFGLWASGR